MQTPEQLPLSFALRHAVRLSRALPLLDGFEAVAGLLAQGRQDEAFEALRALHSKALDLKAEIARSERRQAQKSRP